jgi:hypothetical protein
LFKVKCVELKPLSKHGFKFGGSEQDDLTDNFELPLAK